MADRRNTKNVLQKLICAVVLLALAFAVEWGYSALTSRGLVYPRTETDAGAFTSWEIEGRGGGTYYMLANNSYFISPPQSGLPVYALEVNLQREDGDNTTSIVRYTGTKSGIYGEYVTPLTPSENGVYTAVLEVDALESYKIYPTEKAYSTVRFGGVVANPANPPAAFSFARVPLWLFLLAAAALLADLLLRRFVGKYAGKAVPVSGWLRGYVFVGAGVLLTVFLSIRFFTAARALGVALLPAALAGYSLVYLFALLLFRYAKKIEVKAAIAAAVCGVLLCFANAPLQAPDEATHFLRAYSISQGSFVFDFNHEYPDDVYHLADVFGPNLNETNQQQDLGGAVSFIREYQAVRDTAYQGRDIKTYIQVLFPYLPAALGIAVSRMLGFGALGAMYAARISNVLIYALCVFFAIKWAKRYRGALMATALLPLSLYMAASASYDAMFLSALLLFFGLVCKEEIGPRHLAVLLLSFACFVAIKPTYLPLILLVLLIPRQQFRFARLRRWQVVALTLACGIALYGATMLYADFANIGIPPTSRLEGVDVEAQALYVLKNPLRYILVMAVDGYQGSFYLTQFGLFGWLDLQAPLTSLLSPIVLVIVGALYADQRRENKRTDPLIHLATLVLSYVVVVTGFYCAWSSLGSTSILGVQARYLIPGVPCLVALLSTAFSPLLRFRDAVKDRELIRDRSCVYLCTATAMLATLEIAVQYFLM